MAGPYTDPNTIAQQLSVTWAGGAERLAAQVAAQAASDWIDRYLGASWQSPLVLAEPHAVGCPEGRLWLRTVPVVSVQAVRGRAATVGATPVLLTAGTDYELVDAAHGELLLAATGYARYAVDYTVSSRAPTRVSLAATLLAGQLLGSVLQPGTGSLKSVSLDGELSLTFADYAATAGLPPAVLGLLGPRVPVLA